MMMSKMILTSLLPMINWQPALIHIRHIVHIANLKDFTIQQMMIMCVKNAIQNHP